MLRAQSCLCCVIVVWVFHMIPRFIFLSDLPRLFFLTGCGAVALALAGCLAKIEQPAPKSLVSAHINNTTKFTSADFGVKGSPRVTTARTCLFYTSDAADD